MDGKGDMENLAHLLCTVLVERARWNSDMCSVYATTHVLFCNKLLPRCTFRRNERRVATRTRIEGWLRRSFTKREETSPKFRKLRESAFVYRIEKT